MQTYRPLLENISAVEQRGSIVLHKGTHSHSVVENKKPQFKMLGSF